ncbi:MAG: M48 family metallopeptidase [Chloroflexota bacterium]|nr:M48 family metallopeptidase [Chloroflexota bacterium]
MSRRAAPVEIPGLDVAKAKRYNRTKLRLMIASLVWSVAKMIWLARGQRSRRLQQRAAMLVPDARLAGPAFFGIATILSWLSSLPLAYLAGHRVERRYALTKQTDASWLGDQIKGLAVGLVLQIPLMTGAYAVIRRRPRDWWVLLSAATVPLIVLLVNLAPVLIMPLFNTFERLQDARLAGRVERLAERAGVAIAGVFAMDMSRQSEKPNAFFTGIGNTKRIVLGDTLVDKFTPEEVEGVVAHELGHQVHGDIWRLIAFGTSLTAAGAYAIYRLAPPLVRRTAHETGVHDLGDEASLPLLALVGTAVGFVSAPMQAAFSRAIERRTDRYALDLTENGPAYASAMERLAALSLTDPDPSPAEVFFLYSHPPIGDRIRAARDYAKGND